MMTEPENPFIKSFSDPDAVSRYLDGPPRFTPGLADLHKMTTILLSEHADSDAQILVLGAGGGLELKAMATARPGWRFEGVDPASEMLNLARNTLGPLATRVGFVEGVIDHASTGPFDGAVCLLTLHFLKPPERLRTAKEVHRRLKPGAPFVVAHSSFPQGEGVRDHWLRRYELFAIASGVDPLLAAQARRAVGDRVEILEPEHDERFIADRPNARDHISFGYGIHRCIGARLAELQLRVLMEEMAERRIEIELAGTVVREANPFLSNVLSVPVTVS